MKIFVVQNICLRCGHINEIELGLINGNDNAVYRCTQCKFIVITSWMIEK